MVVKDSICGYSRPEDCLNLLLLVSELKAVRGGGGGGGGVDGGWGPSLEHCVPLSIICNGWPASKQSHRQLLTPPISTELIHI